MGRGWDGADLASLRRVEWIQAVRDVDDDGRGMRVPGRWRASYDVCIGSQAP